MKKTVLLLCLFALLIPGALFGASVEGKILDKVPAEPANLADTNLLVPKLKVFKSEISKAYSNCEAVIEKYSTAPPTMNIDDLKSMQEIQKVTMSINDDYGTAREKISGEINGITDDRQAKLNAIDEKYHQQISDLSGTANDQKAKDLNAKRIAEIDAQNQKSWADLITKLADYKKLLSDMIAANSAVVAKALAKKSGTIQTQGTQLRFQLLKAIDQYCDTIADLAGIKLDDDN